MLRRFAFCVAAALSGCQDGTGPDTAATQPDVPTTGIEQPKLPAAAGGVRGAVLAQDFTADQILIGDHKIEFRQGRDFFADRGVTISVFPDTLPKPGLITHGNITLSVRSPNTSLPDNHPASAYELNLVFGRANELGVPVQVSLETHDTPPSRVVGGGFATFDDIRVANGAIDLQWDSFDTLRHVAREYVQRTHPGMRIEKDREFGVLITSPGRDDLRKTAFIGYELDASGSQQLIKLQLLKGDGGWAVANELAPDEINDAHPLPVTDEQPVNFTPEVIAARALEQNLKSRNLMPHVRATNISCYTGEKEGRGSCLANFEWVNDGRILCKGRNFRMQKDAQGWRVTGDLTLNERLDYLTGNLVEHKPTTFGCRPTEIEPAT